MKLIKISTDEYRLKEESQIVKQLQKKHPNTLVIPEGGSNKMAIEGCEEIYDEIKGQADPHKKLIICISAGTGTTASGILAAANPEDQIMIFNALKNKGLADTIKSLCPDHKASFKIMDQFHFGGFAKVNAELISFINDFNSEYNILLDPIYTGKMMFGLRQLIKEKILDTDDYQLLCYHSGGLQGINGFNERFKNSPDLLIKRR